MKAWVMGAELVAEESWLCWEEGEWICDVHARPRRTVLRKTATEDGAAEDGAAVVAVIGTHGLGGPCYGRPCYGRMCYGRRCYGRRCCGGLGPSTKKPAKHKGLRVRDGCRFSS